MSTMVEARLAAGEFALQETLSRVDGAEFEMVRMAAHSTEHVMPYLWARADDREALLEAVDDDPSVEDASVVSRLDEQCLLEVAWQPHVRVAIYTLLQKEATILDASASDEVWQLEMLFPRHDLVSATYDCCQEYGIGVEFEKIREFSGSSRRGPFGLTEGQHETLTDAFQAGYYEVPRKITLEGISDRHEVSHQALSERLRRGHRTLIANALTPDVDQVGILRGTQP